MSGGIFKPSEETLVEQEESVDPRARAPPLLCPLCNEEYQDPRVLQCYHSFCANCLRGRANSGQINCPLCGTSTRVLEGEELPPSDSVLRFLVNANELVRPPCANCDGESATMFFCETCSQPLCETCRRDTHRARMFSSHQITPLSQHLSRAQQQVCGTHHEPYIMFSLDKRSLLCINCFKELPNESRTNCLDLDDAYTKGCSALEEATTSLRDLQSGVQDGIWLLRGLLDELKQNSESEKSSVKELHSALQDQLSIKRDELMKEIQQQHNDKEREFREQLCSLNSLLPAIHTHLVTCNLIVSEASKIEFLEQGYTLIERINAISAMQHPLQPQKSSQIEVNPKVGFARCMEELLDLKMYSQSSNLVKKWTPPGSVQSSQEGKREILDRYSSPATTARSSPEKSACCNCKSPGHHSNESNTRKGIGGYSGKIIIVEAGGTFAEHCKEFEAKHREILQRFEGVKLQVQELQRDITQRKCMAKKAKVFDLKDFCSTMDSLIKEHSVSIEEQRRLLEKHWDDSYQRVTDEQELYQAQVDDAMRIKTESDRLKRMLKQLAPFIKSINVLSQKISPKLGETTKVSEQGETMTTILHQINSLEPDSQLRVDAIHKSEEDRQNAAANRTDPLVKELIKTKEILKSPGARKTPGMKRGNSFESIVKPKVAEIMTGTPVGSPEAEKLSSASEIPVQNTGVTDAENTEVKHSRSSSEGQSPVDKLDQIEEDVSSHPAVKKSQSLPLRGSKKRLLSRGDSGNKKDGVSLRELLHDEIVSWGEQRERQRDKTEKT